MKRKGCLLSWLMICFTLFSCDGFTDRDSKKPDVVLIVADALRAGQLPSHGCTGIRTPHINNLVKNGVRFENCFVKTPGTLTSFSNLFTGMLFPSKGLLEGEKTMAEYFRDAGYRTVGFVSSRVLWSTEFQEKGRIKNQFYRGFDEYVQDASLKKFPYHRKNEATTGDVIHWLDNRKRVQKPFFLFVHYMDPHAPYDPSYDGEIVKIDNELGKIVRKLKALNIYEDSLLIFTSDHGESLGDPVSDHGSPKGHGWFLYNEQIQIPLIMKFPKSEYVESIRQVARNIDMLPTLLDFIGEDYKPGVFDGKSFLPAIQGGKQLGLTSFSYSAGTRVCPEGTFAFVFPFEENLFKLIRGGYSDHILELYNLTDDPREKRNLIGQSGYSPLVIGAKSSMEEYVEIAKSIFDKKRKGGEQQNPKELEALKSLGYVGGGAPAPVIVSNYFLMRIKVGKASIEYHSIIRDPRWGLDRGDAFFPIKIVPVNKTSCFIIANSEHELYEIELPGSFKKLEIDGVHDIAYDFNMNRLVLLKDEILYVSTPGESPDIEFTRMTDLASILKPEHIDVDAHGDIFVSGRDMIIHLDETGALVNKIITRIEEPRCLAVDERGDIVSADKNTIYIFTREGELSESFTGAARSDEISSVAVDGEGLVWVLEKNFTRINVYERTGKKVTSFKYYDRKIKKGWKPTPTRRIALHDDKLLLVDNWEGVLVYSVSRKQ